jgi:hypothetical protein
MTTEIDGASDSDDEEVELSCLAGARDAYHDSDMDSTPPSHAVTLEDDR